MQRATVTSTWVTTTTQIAAAKAPPMAKTTITRISTDAPLEFFGRPVNPAVSGARASGSGNDRLERLGHVCHGNEPSWQTLHADLHRGRGRFARAFACSGRLCNSVHAGRRNG